MAASGGSRSPPDESAGSRDRSGSPTKRKARRDVYDCSSSEDDDESEQRGSGAAAASSALGDSPSNRSQWPDVSTTAVAVPGTRSAFCMDRRLLVQAAYERRAASATPRSGTMSTGAMRHQLRLPSAAESARSAKDVYPCHRPHSASASVVADANDGPMLQTSMVMPQQTAHTPSTRGERRSTALGRRLRLSASSSSQQAAGPTECTVPETADAGGTGTKSKCRRNAARPPPLPPAQRMLTRSATATGMGHNACQLLAIDERCDDEGAKTSPKEVTTKKENDDKLRFPAWLFKDPKELVERMHHTPTGAKLADEFVKAYGYMEDACPLADGSKSKGDAADEHRTAGPSE